MMAGEKYLQILISEWYFNLLFPKGWGGGGGGGNLQPCMGGYFQFYFKF